MKRPFIAIAALGLLGSIPTALMTAPAQAANSSVENMLRSRPELATFYQALVNTGVINELRPGTTYTIFAPTNEAFARISQQQYPCFYSVECKAEVADILRNHIVAGQQVPLNAPRANAVFSIDGRSVNIGEPHKGSYTADGKDIINQRMFSGGMLYTINGVIANPQELANVEAPRYIPVVYDTVPRTTEKVVTEQVYYAPDGTPDGSTTRVTRTVTHY